jgi:hypothetical protein
MALVDPHDVVDDVQQGVECRWMASGRAIAP